MFSRTFTGIIASSRNNGGGLTQGTIYTDANYYPAINGPSACTPTQGPPPMPPPAPMPNDVWYTGLLLVGDFVYSDSGGVTPWPSGWWKITVTGVGDTAVELDSNGEILNTFGC